jgi:hypothetical protein
MRDCRAGAIVPMLSYFWVTYNRAGFKLAIFIEVLGFLLFRAKAQRRKEDTNNRFN